MKDYSISQLAALLGISPQTIRNYEKSGLLIARRSENQYRSYTSPDLTTLIYIRLYKNLGFTSEEIRSILCQQKSDFAESFSKKEAELQEKIEHLQWQQQELRRQREKLDDYERNRGRIYVGIQPACQGLLFRENKGIKQELLDKRAVPKLIAKMPQSRMVMYIAQKDFHYGGDDYAIGLSTDKDTWESLRSTVSANHLFQIDSRVCLIFTANIDHVQTEAFKYENEGFLARTFRIAEIQKYMDAHGMQVTGDIIAESVHHTAAEKYRAFIWKFYVPIMDVPVELP